jgi:hypothetical protein
VCIGRTYRHVSYVLGQLRHLRPVPLTVYASLRRGAETRDGLVGRTAGCVRERLYSTCTASLISIKHMCEW